MSLTMQSRKIISMFKTFIDKVFVPQLPKMDIGCQKEWTKFSSFFSTQQVPVNQIQFYIDSLPTLSGNGSVNTNPVGSFNGLNVNNMLNRNNGVDRGQNKSPLFMNKKDSNSQSNGSNNPGFNPLKSVGGERNRIIFQQKDYEQPPQNTNLSKDISKEKEQFLGLSTQAVLPSLQRLFKVFADNQVKLEKVGIPVGYEPRMYQI